MKNMALAVGCVIAFAQFVQAIPLPEHPRPDWEREEWVNLNGEWDFGFAADKLDEKILVPFGWGSPLSGVKDKGDTGYYRRSVTIPAEWKGKRVFVIVGASDHDTTCTFDGEDLGKHSGGYTPFEYELTPYVKWGEAQSLEFKVWDPGDAEARDGHYLYGKQGYGNARGIWQTVYLEARGDEYVDVAWCHPSIKDERVGIGINLGAPAKKELTVKVTVDGHTEEAQVAVGELRTHVFVNLPKPHLWTLDDPYLYDVKIEAGDDVVKTYFGFREIGTGLTPNGDNYVTLNGKPIYLETCLDQSYHPEGWYTFPTDEFMKNEILISKRLGLNGNRVHIKVEIPRKLYWADKLGLLIQADVPCAWGDASEAMFEEHWKCFTDMVRRDFNHPSIYQWTLFNETWGLFNNRTLTMGLAAGRGGKKRTYRESTQRLVANAYCKAKDVDPTRIIEDNSPCNRDHVVTDINTWHAYRPGFRWEETVAGFCNETFVGSKANYIGGHVQTGEVMMNSECGNVWGYEGSAGDVDLTWDYHLMINAFRRHPKCAGWLYTEHHDVCNEWNGYVRFDRTEKIFGIEELFPGMSIRDLHADAYMPLDLELFKEVEPKGVLETPVDVSLMSDRYEGKTLTLTARLRYFDNEGKLVEGEEKRVAYEGKAKSWMHERLCVAALEAPSVPACGTANFTLYADGEAIAKNFLCFATKGRFGATEPTKAEWSVKQWTARKGLKHNGAGTGYFEYEFAAPQGACTFRAEVSTKRLNGKDRDEKTNSGTLDYMLGGGTFDHSKNPNSYPQTSAVEKYSGKVTIYANGVKLKTVELEDDPADHRGILSWAMQSREKEPGKRKGIRLDEAGSYGYLVEAEIPEAIVKASKDGKLVIRLEAEESGLAVYGPNFGRYPFGPYVK